MLEVRNISKQFKRKQILHDVTFKIEKGVFGILGPNGSGKTTLLRILATVYHPTKGELKLNGLEWKTHIERAREKIGYLPQHVGLLTNLTAYEYLDYIAILRGMNDKSKRVKRIQEVLDLVNLSNKKDEKIKKLSGGMKQRIGIAQAIIHEPELLLVDEPTAGLDPEERLRFRGLLRELALGRTIILSTHITDDISMTCDFVGIMKGGRLKVFDTLQEVSDLARNKVWQANVSKEEFLQLHRQKNLQIVSSTETSNHELEIRFIADEKINNKAEKVKPRLEEGYMIWLNNYSNI